MKITHPRNSSAGLERHVHTAKPSNRRSHGSPEDPARLHARARSTHCSNTIRITPSTRKTNDAVNNGPRAKENVASQSILAASISARPPRREPVNLTNPPLL